MNPLTTWRLPLRLARRDALRHKARSALVLVMIALPVLAVTAADVLTQTSQVSGAESLDRRIGASEALVTVTDGVDQVLQGPDPDAQFPQLDGDGDVPAPTGDQVSSLLDGATLVELRQGEVQVATDKGQTSAEAVETDLQQPVTRGLYDLTSGRLPRAAGEVVVNQALLDKGYAVGDPLDADRGRRRARADDRRRRGVGRRAQLPGRLRRRSAPSACRRPAPPSGWSTAARSRGPPSSSSTRSARWSPRGP